MVEGPGQYKWSSYRANALRGNENEKITPHSVYEALGDTSEKRQEAYRALFRCHIDKETLTLIRKSTQQSTVIGMNHFQEEIEKRLKRRVMK